MMRGIDHSLRVVSLLILLAAAIAALRWNAAQRYPLWWDEANYYNQVFDDRQAILQGGPAALAKSLLFADQDRPPAYRALAAPFVAVTLPSLSLLRTFALCVTISSMLLLWRACRTVASPASALLGTALVFTSPAILASGSWFGTEYPLLLAVALLLDSLLRDAPLGVAAGIALGLLAKASFLTIGGPVMLAALLTARHRDELRRLLLASACGGVVAASWWYWNVVPALRFAQLGRTFARAAFTNPLSLATLGDKLLVLASAIGAGVAIAAVLLGIDAVRGQREPVSRAPTRLTAEARRPLLLAASGGVPLLVLTLLSPVFVQRHVAPALLVLALPLALLLDRARPAVRAAIAVIALLHVAWMAVAPTTFLPRVEQTDWRRLRALVPAPTPRIAFLGGWRSLSPPEIRYGWTRDGLDATTTWLWRSEERQIDWANVMREALASDAVLVVPPSAASIIPNTLGRTYERADNRHNAELIQRLETSGQFAQPVPFRIGTREQADLLVYRRLAFRPSGQE
jgi:hypothetical protein